jgi:serine protease Do
VSRVLARLSPRCLSRGRLPACALALLVLLAVPTIGGAKPAPDSFADLAAKLLPAVVNISSTQTIKPGQDNSDDSDAPSGPGNRGGGGGGGNRAQPDIPQFPPGSPFEQFFKDFLNRNRQGPQQDTLPRQQTSLGSGFIVDASGLVATNHHVIDKADTITVTLQDGTNFKAEIVGQDTKTDLALLRIKSDKTLPAIKFGDSDKTRVGDWVLAIGNPFGLGGSVTAGILSARARDINSGPYDDFLQTDASINRGNSGGPMFNMDGEVVGINTAIFSPSGGSVGIGFAIPSNLAKPIIAQIKEFGKPKRGWLGVRIQTVSPELAEGLRLPQPKGALVASVTKDGPADQAGIKQGDVVLKFDGKEITQMRGLPRIVAETETGKTADVVIWRKGAETSLKVKVGELTEEAEQKTLASVESPPSATATIDLLGLKLSAITDELRTKYQIGSDIEGVVVVDVAQSSAAAEKDMRPGDVIAEVDQKAVTSPDDVSQRVKAAQDNGYRVVTLLVNRAGDFQWIALKIAQ